MSIFEVSGDSVYSRPIIGASHYDLNSAGHPVLTDRAVGKVEFQKWKASDAVAPDIPSGYYHPLGAEPFVTLTTTKVSERENSPRDTPKGIGYKALAADHAYLKPKHLHHFMFHWENLYQVIDYAVPTGISNHAYFAQPFPVSYSSSFYTSISPVSSDFHDFLRDLHDKAIRNLYASFSKRVKINGGVLLGELHESMGLLGKACTQLMLIIRAVKRGRLSEAIELISEYTGGRVDNKIRTRKTINRRRRHEGKTPITKSEYSSSMWLELHFGWMPIISDIYSIIEYINDVTKDIYPDKAQWFSFSGYASGKYSGQFSTSELDYWLEMRDCQLSGSSEWRVAYTATLTLEDPLVDTLNTLGLVNPGSVAWELVPFSFVLDWFVPIGDWIESFTAHAGLKLLDVSVTEKSIKNLKFSPAFMHANLNRCAEIPLFIQSFDRTIFPGPDVELPDFPKPTVSLENIVRPWHLLTSLALFKAVSGKR